MRSTIQRSTYSASINPTSADFCIVTYGLTWSVFQHMHVCMTNLLWPLIESVGALILSHAATQVVYSHYILIPFMECLWYVKFCYLCLQQEDKSIEWKTKGQAMMLRINVLWYNRFVLRHKSPFLWGKPGSICLPPVGLTADWEAADKLQVEVENFKIPYTLNYFMYV